MDYWLLDGRNSLLKRYDGFKRLKVFGVVIMNGLTHKVMKVVRAHLAREGVSVELEVTDKLRDCGLTSVQLVSLIFVVETEFDIAIPDSELTPGNFTSVDTITRMLCTLRSDLVTCAENTEPVLDVHGSIE